MSMINKEIVIKCPFCKIGDIKIIHIPKSVRFKKGSWGGSKPGIISTEEKVMIVDKECQNCRKTSKEIEKALKTGNVKEITHEEFLKRLKNSGLPTLIESKKQE